MKKTLLSISRILNHKLATPSQKERALNCRTAIESGDIREINSSIEIVKKIVLELIKAECDEKDMRIR